MLHKLSGKAHTVFTGLSLIIQDEDIRKTGYDATRVIFNELKDGDIFNPVTLAKIQRITDFMRSGIGGFATLEDAAAAVVDSLGRETFSQAALDLVTAGDSVVAVPSDSWAQMLVYRKDLFDAANVPYPEPGWTWDNFLNAALALREELARLEVELATLHQRESTLRQALADTLAAGRQALLFMNRRGYAGFLLCRRCGHVPMRRRRWPRPRLEP